MSTVLLDDDDVRLLDALEALVSLHGYRAVTALDGAQALQYARRERPAIIVTDCMMPGMDGVALVRELAADPVLSTVPVIVCSAVAAPPPAAAC